MKAKAPKNSTPTNPKLLPQPKVRTKAEQEHYERVTARNLFLQTRTGPCPTIYA